MSTTTLPKPPTGTTLAPPPARTVGPSPPPLAPRPPEPPHRRSGPRWVLALAIVGGITAIGIGLILLGSRGSDEGDPPGGGPAGTVDRPVSEAVLAGSYEVRLVATAAKGWESLHVGDDTTETWSFSPNGTRLNGRTLGGSWVIVLDRVGPNTHGSTKAQLSECQFTPVTDSLRVRMKVVAGHSAGDRWVAQRFVGTLHMYSPPATSGLWSCQSSTLTERLVGIQR